MKSYGHFSKRIACILGFVFLFHMTPLALGQSGKATKKEKPEQFVSIDFNDVDISVFIKFMSELTGKNFIIDRRVKGKVTIISPSKISVKEAYKVFESVLEVHGFATVKSGEVIKIVSSPEARTKSIETLMREESRSPDDKVVTQLIPLRYADPSEIKRLFTPLISKSSVILSYPSTNTLIITDVYSNIKRLMRILKTIDVPGVGQEIALIPVEYGDATKLVKTLQTLFQKKRSKKKGAALGTIKFVADERTNTLIVLASEDEVIKIRDLVTRLDKEVPKGKEKIHVYYLENADAEELAKVLQSLSSKQKRTTTAQKGKKKAPIVSEKTNISADKATNSLIIMADKDDYLVLEEVIKKLDGLRSMVYIECLIMEVNVDKAFTLGVEWSAMGEATHDGTSGGYGGGFGGGDPGSAYSGISGLVTPNTTGTTSLPAGLSMALFGEAVKIGGVYFPNLAALINAYKKDKDVHILSTPQIMTMDNEEASIYTGKNIPYQTKSAAENASDTYSSYEYKDVGMTLKITPQISKDRMIRLKINHESSTLDQAESTGAASRPTTLKRTIDTTVIINDKSTIAIGGLIQDDFTETEYKVPCIGDIPGLGWLFRSNSRGRNKTNLFVFITPHVIQNPAEAEEIYREKKEHLDSVEKDEGIKMYKRQYREDEALPESVEE